MRDELRKPFPTAQVNLLLGDIDNLRAAMTWGFQEQPMLATEIMKMLFPLWVHPGYYSEGRRWYERILERGDEVDPKVRAHVLGRSARLAFQQGDYAVFLAHQEERSCLYEALGDEARLARSLVLRGTAHTYMGSPGRAFPLYERARALYEKLGDATNISRIETSIGLASFLTGDFEDARHRFELSRIQAERDGLTDRVQTSVGNIAMVDVMQGRPADAKRRIRECMQINRKVKNLYGISHDLPALAEATRQEGDLVGAARWLGACDALLEKIDAKLEALELDIYDRAGSAVRKAIGDEAFESARDEGRRLSWEDIVERA
jgi:non-specific serine/threonine protein kinase